ncbi:MAG: hypothetical protein LBU94_01340 [Clostridiales bacterium]|nr:hypothetical protein [Clostridiales bacterium]
MNIINKIFTKKSTPLLTETLSEALKIQNFIDTNAPSTVKFLNEYCVMGNDYRAAWAVKYYPATNEEMAILRNLGEKSGVTLKAYITQLTPHEERRIMDNAINSNRMYAGDGNMQKQVIAGDNLNTISEMLLKARKQKEPFCFCSVLSVYALILRTSYKI